MICPKCKSSKGICLTQEHYRGRIFKKRTCGECRHKYETVEIHQERYDGYVQSKRTLAALGQRSKYSY